MMLFQFFRSSVGLKILMAVSGFILFGFVFVHMVGNLQIFLGQETLNEYAHFLKSEPILLWAFRLTLLAAVVVHILAGWGLYLHNKSVRPVNYQHNAATGASLASRTMVWSGTIVLAFIIFHLLQFTIGSITPAYLTYRDAQQHQDVYRMVLEAFSIPWVAAFYVLSVALLCYHLSHGVNSFFRTLGFTNDAWSPLQLWFARLFSTVIFLGMAAVPISVQLHYLKLNP